MTEFNLRPDDPNCEDLAILWQTDEIDRLNTVLKDNGVADRVRRQAILEEFFFHLATRLDASSPGLEHNEKEYIPRLVFEEPGEAPTILISDQYDLHDYTHSDIFNIMNAEEHEAR